MQNDIVPPPSSNRPAQVVQDIKPPELTSDDVPAQSNDDKEQQPSEQPQEQSNASVATIAGSDNQQDEIKPEPPKPPSQTKHKTSSGVGLVIGFAVIICTALIGLAVFLQMQ